MVPRFAPPCNKSLERTWMDVRDDIFSRGQVSGEGQLGENVLRLSRFLSVAILTACSREIIVHTLRD